MKYNIEDIATAIQDHISFEDGLENIKIDNELEFEEYTVSFDGFASGYENMHGESILGDICINTCVVFDNDDEYHELPEIELIKLETLITW